MNSQQDLLDLRGLTVTFPGRERPVRVVEDFDLTVGAGERVALVGESGSGKSVTAKTVLRMNPRARVEGRVTFDGVDLLALSENQMRSYRGASIGVVFQDPLSALDPRMRIGRQVEECLRIRGVGRAQARERALTALEEMQVPRAVERLKAYPHELSGGMRQRVVIAMAMIAEPRLLIADEPTTALDPRVQDEVLELMYQASERRGLAVIFITHDLGLVADFADRVVVMYAGRKAEEASVEDLFGNPVHPYTRALLHAVPRIDGPIGALEPIAGSPPTPAARPAGCAFHPRCRARLEAVEAGVLEEGRCRTEQPALTAPGPGRTVSCHLVAAGRVS